MENLNNDDWRPDGECEDLSFDEVDQIFFPERQNGYVNPAAVELCGRCIVQAECLADALENPPTHGIRAGFMAKDLQQMASGSNVIPFPSQEDVGLE